MDAAGDHRRGKMMRASDHVGDNFGFGRIWNRGLQHADDRGGTLAEPDLLADHGGIAFESRGPETIGEHGRASGVGAVVMHVQEPATTPARTSRGSPRPTTVNPMVEKSPNSLSVLIPARRS